MRILNVTWILTGLVAAVAATSGCQKPEAESLPKKVDVTHTKNAVAMPPALWFASSDSSSGFLGRLDLKKGDLKFDVLPVDADTVVFQDGAEGLFLLARGFLGSVRVLRGPEARVDGYKSLPPPRPSVYANAQGVARDLKGRVWVTTMESNNVLVFSADLRQQVGSVDLSSLKESNEPDAVADLAQIAKLDDGHMVVTAQRLHRLVRGMPPAAQSGLAVIDIETLKPVSSGLVNLVNPMQMAVGNGKVTIVGGGDLFAPEGPTGRIAGFSGASLVMDTPEDLPCKIPYADLTMDGEPPAIIAWYPKENKSCVQIGQRKLACDDGGFVFFAIKRAGDSIFVSFKDPGHAQLWVLDANGVAETKKYDVKMPIQSMSFGP